MAQNHFRFGINSITQTNDPDEIAWGTVDAGITQVPVNQQRHIRIQIENHGPNKSAQTWQLYYNDVNNPATASAVGSDINVVNYSADPWIADETATDDDAVVWENPSGLTWVNGLFTENAHFGALALANDKYTDFQACIIFGYGAYGNVYYFFMRYNGAVLGSYPPAGADIPTAAIVENPHLAAPFLLREFTEEESNALYAKYHPMLEGLTNDQKEDKLVELVSDGEISADKALVIASREGLDVGS